MARIYYRSMSSGRASLVERQLARLNAGLELLVESNPFYRRKLEDVRLPICSMADFAGLPFTTKAELVSDQASNPPYGTNLTYPPENYTRIHSTSGTTGRRLKVLDTDESFRWFTRCWREMYRIWGVGPGDRVFAAFGFGPFVGFWAGFEAAYQVGAQAIPGGGQSSLQRLDAILDSQATVLLSTPTYALRLAEAARENGIDISQSAVRATIHGGEPGASIPGTRKLIESAWGARAWDHAGLSEVGAWGYECPAEGGLHVLESEFIAEVLEVDGDSRVAEDQTGELVLTNLGRWAAPVLRYRTGDLVRLRSAPCSCGSSFLRFPGGVLGRADDMILVRGVNVYPTAIESIVREERAVSEFQVRIFERRGMWEMQVSIELADSAEPEAVKRRLENELHVRLGLRTEVRIASPGSLPRFELKARRYRLERAGSQNET
jgi:phenylacetate-CoA ligase